MIALGAFHRPWRQGTSGEDLARGGTPLHSNRGEHFGAATGRAALGRRARCREQGSAGIHGGPGLRERRRLGLQPWRSTREWSDGQLLSLTELRQIHTRTMAPVWDVAPHPDATEQEAPGSFRRHEIEPFSNGMGRLPGRMSLHRSTLARSGMRASWNTRARTTVALAAVHTRFEQIHPFLDGNGRAGRLIMNLLLVRIGYPPAIIYKSSRNQYLGRFDGRTLVMRPSRGVPSSLDPRQPLQVHRAGHRGARPGWCRWRHSGTPGLTANALRVAAVRGRLRGGQSRRWHMAELSLCSSTNTSRADIAETELAWPTQRARRDGRGVRARDRVHRPDDPRHVCSYGPVQDWFRYCAVLLGVDA